MHVAIDDSPISELKQTKHRVRGVGYYIRNLKINLDKYYPKDNFSYFHDTKSIPLNTDIVHYPYFEPFFLSLPSGSKYRTVVTVHDLTPLVFPEFFPSGIKGRLKWEIQKKRLRRSRRIITDSAFSKNDIVKFTGIKPDKIDVVYLAASDSFRVIRESILLTRIRNKYNLPEIFLLYVGDATWNKNLVRLVHAVKKTGLPLVMCGKALVEEDIDTLNPWNQDLVTVQSIVKNDPLFIRLGFVEDEDLPVIYNLATIFIMPSLYEGFGLPLLEAMKSRVPVITSKEGSIPEVVGEAAYYVDAYSDNSIAKGIGLLMNDKSLRSSLVKKGQFQANKFSWEETARNTYQVYLKSGRS